MQKRILMAMSGGVDSSVAAKMLQQQGYEVVGATLKVWSYEKTYFRTEGNHPEHDFIKDAQLLAQQLGIEHHVFDIQELFEKTIIGNFIDEYLCGRTPNPCIICNPTIKWKYLLEQADKLNCSQIATGHYVTIKHQGGRFFVAQGADKWKDQSYVLWKLPQLFLARTIFPIGNLCKTETREKAFDYGFAHIAEKSESYDVCFIPDGNYRDFICLHHPDIEKKLDGGLICDKSGKCLGHHKGFPFYTIGQRKGLEVAVGHPVYVTQIDADHNRIILGEKEDLLSDFLYVRDYNIMKYESLPSHFRALVKIRYKDKGTMAEITQEGDRLLCVFDKPVSAVTPGQSAVFYEDEDVVGGGIIV